MKTYRTAVIGLTGIAASLPGAAPDPVLGTHMPHSHVSTYAQDPRTTVVAVCDLVPALIERFKDQWGSTFPEARGYTDYREMLAREQVDILSVVTSDHRHAQMVVDATEAGVKGIFCEKPIATTLADADRMIAACKQHGVPLLIDHTRRWYPEFREARNLVRSGAIGELRRIIATGGGPRAMIFRNGTHLIDSVCFFAESDPEWVVAELDDEHRDYGPRYAGDGGKDPATDPGASAYVHFKNGVRAFISFSKRTTPSGGWELIGDKGGIKVGSFHNEMWQQTEDRRTVITPLRPAHTTRGDTFAAIGELIGLMENGGTGSSTGEDGRRTLSIILGILQSNAAGSARINYPIHDA